MIGRRMAKHVLEVTLRFLLLHLLLENHEARSVMGKSQLHLTNDMLDEFSVFLIQVQNSESIQAASQSIKFKLIILIRTTIFKHLKTSQVAIKFSEKNNICCYDKDWHSQRKHFVHPNYDTLQILLTLQTCRTGRKFRDHQTLFTDLFADGKTKGQKG